MAEQHIDDAVKAAEAAAHGDPHSAHTQTDAGDATNISAKHNFSEQKEVSGLERAALGGVSAGWKMPIVYAAAASSAVYAPYALPAALAVGAAFFSLNYFGLNYPPIRKLYQAFTVPLKNTAKDLFYNGATYVKNFLTATLGLAENLVTFPAKLLPSSSGAHGAAPSTPHAAPAEHHG